MESKNLPVWLYHKDEGAKLFTDADEAAAAREDGWKDSPAAFDHDDGAPDERDELAAKAEALGIQVDKRWGAKRIQKAIDDHDDGA